MGLFDFMTKAQDKLNALQKGIEDYQKRIEENPAEIFPKKHKADPKEKQPKKKKAARIAPSAESQILALRDQMVRNSFKEYEFIANKNCCEICGRLNGKHFPISKFEIGVTAPPMHEGCSCSIAAYSDREEYEKWLNNL